MVAVGGVKSVARTRQSSQAAAAAPRPRKASGTPAEHLKSSYPAIFAGGRSRPEGSEGVRDAGQVWPGTRRTLQPPRGLGKYQNAPLNVSEASEGLKHAAERFRGLGRRQGRRPSLPGTRKTSQAAAAAPRLRKASGTPAKSCRVPGKLPCLGRGRQGRRPSLTGYQENFAGGRSRPKPPRGLWF